MVTNQNANKMLHAILQQINPLETFNILLIGILLLVFALSFYKKYKLLVLYILTLAASLLIVYITFYRRETMPQAPKPILEPLYFIFSWPKQKETFFLFGLNILLFLPFGLASAKLMSQFSLWWLLALLPIFALVSINIELMQFYFSKGVFDVNDIIANTIGGAIGLAVILVFSLIKRQINKRKDR